MRARPGTTKQTPARMAPNCPRRRQAMKIASCVEAGPGSRLVAATPSSNSRSVSQWRRPTARLRRRAICAGGPPKPVLERRKLSYERRSANRTVSPDCRVLLGDSMGEMAAYYAACDLAFIGGSCCLTGVRT